MELWTLSTCEAGPIVFIAGLDACWRGSLVALCADEYSFLAARCAYARTRKVKL
jgi:hypothetical protein